MLLAVLLGLAVDVTRGRSIQLIPQYPVISGSVTLSVTGITGTVELFSWHKGPTTEALYQIVLYFPGTTPPTTVNGPLYNPRFSVFSNGSLQIKDLLISDGGIYTVKIQTQKQEDIPVNLTVYEVVTKPKITASPTQPKENDTFTLTCDTSKAATITWTRRGTGISPETKLSGDNRTLTFSSIKRQDSGEYQCVAQNLVSKESSDPIRISVAYGPDNVRIEGTLFVRPDSSITLSCSVDSDPPPEYQWKINEKVLEQKTSKYSITSATKEDEGLYTCVVKNPVTLRTAAASAYLNVTADAALPPKDFTMAIGIAVAVVLLLILIAAVIYLFLINKRRKTSSNSSSKMKASSPNGQADIPPQTAEQHELQYAAIEFSNNTPRKQEKPETIYENRSPQEPPPSDNVVYSELKLR